MSLSDMLGAIRRDNLEELRTLVSMQKCSDTQDLRNTLLHKAVKKNKKAITEFLLQVGSNPNSGVHSSKPLHIAARNGNLGIIEMLLNHGADINAEDDDGTSPLVYAIENEKDDATEFLLERGARLFSDNEGRSPLHVAATWGSLKVTKMLLQKGAPVNAVITAGFEKGYTPLHYVCSSSEVDIDIIEFLLSNGAGVDLKTERGLTPLHIASEIGNVQVINLLINHNSDIDGRESNGYTPLYLAIESENEGAALLLINRGAKLDDEFCHGGTILRLALRWGLSSTVEEILTRCPDPQVEIEKCKELFRYLSEEMINILLKHCFDIELFHIAIRMGYIQIIESVLKDRLDLTANFHVIRSSVHVAVKSKQVKSAEVLVAHRADVNAKDETGMTPLLFAIQYLNVEMTKLLISHGAHVQIAADDVGKTALHMLASFDEEFGENYASDIAKMLLAAGADVNAATTTEKLTPLHLACERSQAKLVQVFLDHNADVNLRDKNGKTALHFAAAGKCDDSNKLLLENKANVNSQDFDGFTALHTAIYSNNYDVVELLFKFGADINIKDRNNHTPMDVLNRRYRNYNTLIYDDYCLTLKHALALEAINLYYAKDLRSCLSKLYSPDQIRMKSHFENCKQEIEKLKFVKVPGYRLTCYDMMMKSIHYLASYVKNEDLITHFASDDFTTKFRIYAPIIQGRLRNAFQRRPFIAEAGEFFNYYFKLPHVCVDHILSCLSLDDLKNVKDAM